ncbi:type II toxin-antitoxin system prevent-host-death family antitoxin [Streptomyces sp. NPDC127072]|uniref:type II toxin-antitoxin system prevent-host-death family antitoxin n=1 Tax=Streptomyces sp. NPDC127072 TaxID=3347129 RepID=UPI0036590B72
MQHDTTALYRLFDAAGRLLYVGISSNSEERLKQHASTAPWWKEVASHTVESHPERSVAATAELEAIRTEGPRYNRAGSDAPIGREFAEFESVSVAQLRARPADVAVEVAVRNRVIYITSNGRRVAAIVPVAEAEATEARRQTEG